MNNHQQNKIILALSLPLSALIIIVSSVGLLTPDFYSKETANWQAQSIGQDMIDLFLVVPSLLVTSILAFRKNRTASMIWGGVVLYLSYSFVLYCFEIHFNQLFILYCLCLGLSFYSFLYYLFTNHNENHVPVENSRATRFIGIYFIVVALLFYCLWLSEIIPAIMQNSIPKSVLDAGLFTNGVQVLDLAVILPAIFITGVLLLRKVPLGFILTPVILTFFILMDITIAVLTLLMKMKGIDSSVVLSIIMSALALLSLALLVWYFRNLTHIKTKEDFPHIL